MIGSAFHQDVAAEISAGPPGVFAAPDFCSEYNGGCHQHADCLQDELNVTCSCTSGYSGDGNDCSPIDRCTDNNGGCSDFATCVFTGPVGNLESSFLFETRVICFKAARFFCMPHSSHQWRHVLP